MMTIEEEIQYLSDFLNHPCGFEVSLFGILQIRPLDEASPPTEWEVSWIEVHDGVEFESFKEFSTLHEAVVFFVEKRRYMCLGLDFEAVYLCSTSVDVEIEND